MRNFLLNALAVLSAEAGESSDAGGGAPAAPATPPADPAPAQQPKQEPAPKEEPKQEPANEGPEQVQYAETGDATLDYVLGYIGSYGLGPDHPAVKAAQNGEFDQLEIELAKADAKGYDKVLNLARKSYDSFASQQQEAAQQTQQILHDTVGGEEQWGEIQQWAAANAEPEEKEVINKLLGEGGLSARIAAQFLQSAYRDATGTEFKGKAAAADPAPARQAGEGNGPITRRELAAEAQKLHAKYGDAYQQSPEYKALARRLKR